MQGQLCVFDFRFKEKIGCYECIFPNNNVDEELRCADHGILAPVVGIIGTMQALEAIKLILNINNMQSKFLLFDGNQNEWKVIKYHKDKECKICSASSI
jgi:molybdopterin/thiamine biosynthesis adenylyltransferase